MRDYELTIIIKPDLDEEARDEIVNRVTGWLSHGDGETDKPSIDFWGQRTLAYPIQNYTEGYYVFYEAKLDPSGISEIERNIQFVDSILRHLVVRKDR
jgi:small subunit ribosomal protein S6